MKSIVTEHFKRRNLSVWF